MNHLLRPQFGSFRSSLPFRCSFLRFPKTVPSPDPVHDSLKRRIERAPDSMPSLTHLLHEWRQLGNKPGLSELRSIISSLHKLDRFSHALQVSEWMSDQQVYNLSTVDFEIRLLLIAKLGGLEEASKFLDTIPLKKRDFYVHNALLNSCKTHGSLSIAETTFQKMIDLGLASNNPKPYNTMLSLYHSAGDHDMVVKLLLEMDDQRLEPQGVPFGKLFSCFALASCVKDFVGMEKFLNKWRDRMEPWATCFFPACLYMELGSLDKSLSLFRKTEELLDDDCRKNMYGALMRVYCHKGEREDVYRLSNLAKLHGISFDATVTSEMIKFFALKHDFDGAHEIMEEWDTGAGDLGLSDFGHRKRCMKEEADKAINMLGKKWESKWESLTDMLQQNLAEGEDEDGERERRKRVTEALEGRLHERWNPKTTMTLSAYACVQYVEGRRDMESAAEILKLLNKQELVSRAMDKDRLCLKMVEAMRGGGYVGGQD
ncbi:hypothetical protein BRARA_G00019 [Brassica rapa]|uniref:Pentacotripeptide-repeat region of PRORP domain-containing protein n=1 Tax=Brassica campestris TaxID=3711 RepID=M4F5Y7_BRACM|nr:pentatricopeptide repeat-containing protein At2g20710, mitochondrial [Brassica rapa]RID52565.1 hypothetical protein BRARA_G00019 [Brassica rapa]